MLGCDRGKASGLRLPQRPQPIPVRAKKRWGRGSRPLISRAQRFSKAGGGLRVRQGEGVRDHSSYEPGMAEAGHPHGEAARPPCTVSYWSPLSCGHKHSAVPISSHGHQHLALAHLLQGTGQAVEVPIILLLSFPEVQDYTRGTSFGGKVIQVPVGRKGQSWLP